MNSGLEAKDAVAHIRHRERHMHIHTNHTPEEGEHLWYRQPCTSSLSRSVHYNLLKVGCSVGPDTSAGDVEAKA